MPRTSRFVPLVSLSILGFCSLLSADVAPLIERCPPNTNAVIAVDSAHLMKGPLAARLGWAPAAGAPAVTTPRADSPLPFVGVSDALVLAMQWDVGEMEPAWELTILDSTRGGPSVEALASSNGGYVDSVAGKPAGWFRNDSGVVRLDDRTLGLFHPADRQLVARWVKNSATDGKANVSDYLRKAAARASEATPVIIGIDLTDAFGEVGVRRAIDRGDLAALAGGAGKNDAELAKLLAGARGATLELSSSDPPRARLTVDFSGNATLLGEAAKPLVLEVMSESGLSFPDMQKWNFAANGQSVTGEGTMSDDGIGRLLSFVETSVRPQSGGTAVTDRTGSGKPSGDPVPAGAKQAGGGVGSAQQSAAVASQKYYKSVSSILERLKPGASLGDSAAWLARDARRIDQLSTAGVDPDLIAWGGEVSAKMRESASLFSTGQQRVRAASAGTHVPAAYSGGVNDQQQVAQGRADLENSRRQARQAAADERARTTTEAAKPLQDALDARGKIRAEMAKKYGVEF